ncbi:hypothetical protein [uncultured Herbaspirillum sp.]|uniref:hypothetical protein n=1 Tax=uncultured Herbaspirillum sp. TaxID=160236 RepID=UPI00259017E0|nr:hypothetical protein [uncultured Herbaspirillum sp.]
MNLNYSILWFDDEEDWFSTVDTTSLEALVSASGFKLDIKQVTKADDFHAHIPYQNFDLIAVDFNLEEQGEGKDFIKELRSHNILTEVVFYSSRDSRDLWQAIAELQLEGVFVAYRKVLVPKMEMVFRQSVKKILDLENMRGIVMAEVGDIDLLLDEILEKGFQGLEPEKQADIYSRFHSDLSNSASKKCREIATFFAEPSLNSMLQLSDSSKRWENFKRLSSRHDLLTKLKLGDYQQDVLRPRNFLAHGIPEHTEEGKVKFTHHGKHYEFDEHEGTRLRREIGGYREFFEEVRLLLTK